MTGRPLALLVAPLLGALAASCNPGAGPRASASTPVTPPGPAIDGEVACEGCPPGSIHVVAYPSADRYRWPWWDVYGFLSFIHPDGALARLRPAPLAVATLAAPGPFRLVLPAAAPEVHLFALLDVDGSGLATGATPRDWAGRHPRNPVDLAPGAPRPLVILNPLNHGPDFERDRYRSPGSGAQALLRDVTAESGIAFRHCQGGDIGHLPVVVGSGALLEDLDGDSELDLLAVQGLGDCDGAPRTSRLYRNRGNGRFEDATAGSGLELEAAGMGVVGADFDHDGDVDLLFTTLAGARLLRNDGGLRFRDVTREAGIGGEGEWVVAATFGDVDGDSLLDLLVVNYVEFSGLPPFTPDAEIPSFLTPMLSSPFAFPAVRDRLYLGRPGGRFEEAPGALGAADPEGKGMAAVLADLDGDRDLDLFVTNDCSRDRLFENVGGRFADVSRAAAVDDVSSGMGIALGDIDGDGLPDLFSPHWANEPVVLYRNASAAGRLRFADVTAASGLAGAGRGLTGWAAELFDADLDSDLDLLVTNGHTHPGSAGPGLEPQPMQLFRNDGQGRFADWSAAIEVAGGLSRVWRGAATGDVDGDGDVDVYLVSWNGEGVLLRNETPAGNWLKIGLERANGERGAAGARVEVETQGRRLVRDVATGTGYLSHSSLEVEFGLGAARAVEAIEVAWSGGRRERFPGAAAGTTVRLIEGAGGRGAR